MSDCEGKVRYNTACAAYKVLRSITWGRRTKKVPTRVYHCDDCQGYHLTSRREEEVHHKIKRSWKREQKARCKKATR